VLAAVYTAESMFLNKERYRINAASFAIPPSYDRQRRIDRLGWLGVKVDNWADLRGNQVYEVLPRDHRKLREAVVRFARYFRREFGYDTIQYSERYEADPDQCQAFLFGDQGYPEKTFFGACCFRYRHYRDSEPMWALQWAWLHPYMRSKGILKRNFPLFVERFGKIWIEPPLSSAMAGFIEKHHPWQLREMKQPEPKQSCEP
jgi:hypothetical protein